VSHEHEIFKEYEAFTLFVDRIISAPHFKIMRREGEEPESPSLEANTKGQAFRFGPLGKVLVVFDCSVPSDHPIVLLIPQVRHSSLLSIALVSFVAQVFLLNPALDFASLSFSNMSHFPLLCHSPRAMLRMI
jgi:hypothetical protein